VVGLLAMVASRAEVRVGRYHLILLNVLEGDALILTCLLVSIIRDAIDASRSRGGLVICEEAGISPSALAS
jgi:hypothetical protein